MNIAIFMAIWSQNLWDELILKNEINLLKQKYEWQNLKFQVFTYDLNDKFVVWEDIEYFEYFPVWIKNPKNLIRNIKNFINFIKVVKNSSKIVFGWGWIIFDNEFWNYSNPLNQWLFRSIIAKIFNKDIIFWGISVDIKNEENNKKLKSIFNSASEVYVRDLSSKKYLETLDIKSEVILDPVFYDNWEVWLENYKKNFLKKSIQAKDFCLNDILEYDFTNKTVWLALRSWYIKWGNNFWEITFINDLIEYILWFDAKVVLLTHSFHKIDKNVNDYEFLKQFLRPWVEITKTMEETYQNYSQKKIDFCLSMRLHSMILSQVYGIDFIALKYAKKSDLM